MRWKHTVCIAGFPGMSLVQRVSAFDPDNEQRIRDLSSNRISRLVATSIPEGFVPIDVDIGYSLEGSVVTLCKLDFAAHAEQPSRTPMFKDLVRISQCTGENVIMSNLAEIENQDTRLLPTGFVFHESRCGSTLVANILASDPQNIVYSESKPPVNVALHCDFCTPEYRARALRAVIKGMGNVDTSKYKRLFFKFQSVNSGSIDRYLDVFPSVPWMFIFRNPVEVLASYFQASSAMPLCARSKSSPPAEIRALLDSASSVSNEQYCAAYLYMLCKAVLREASVSHNGVVVDYKSIPRDLFDVILPKHFGYELSQDTLARMMLEASMYSKSRGDEKLFEDDSQDKQSAATPLLKRWAQEYVGSLHAELDALAHTHLQQLRSVDRSLPLAAEGGHQVDYKYVDEPNKDADLGRWIADGKVDRYGEKSIVQYLRYPKLRPLKEFLDEWNPDDPDIPPIPGVAEGTLARFNYSDPHQRLIAEVYRLHEVPFILTEVPNIVEVQRKWSDDGYLKAKFGRMNRKVTYSDSNHFMYYNRKSIKLFTDRDYKPPTSIVEMPFETWLEKASAAEGVKHDEPHFYLQLNAEGLDRWIQDDLPLFDPKPSFFTIEEEFNRGINCRFGTRGIIAESHYDGGRNFIAMLRGAKRYVILPPSECKLMELHPRGHPEARHSAVDWSDLDWKQFNQTLGKAQAAQVVVREGEVLYLPSYWFHYIVSTSYTTTPADTADTHTHTHTRGISIQCNSRSGNAVRGRQVLTDCGFY